MELVLVRHTSVNIEKGMCYGWLNVPLHTDFLNEADRVKKKIGNTFFDAIYCSPLVRCATLAQYLAESPAELIFDARLKELNFGMWEGQLWSTIAESDVGKKWFQNWEALPCPEGESYTQLIDRIRDFYTTTLNINRDKRVLIITHGGAIRAFLSVLQGLTPSETFAREIAYGEVLSFTI